MLKKVKTFLALPQNDIFLLATPEFQLLEFDLQLDFQQNLGPSRHLNRRLVRVLFQIIHNTKLSDAGDHEQQKGYH